MRLSTDAFRNLAFKTTWHGIEIHTPEFQLPDWVWAQAAPDQVVHWQALAILPDERRVVGHGAVQRTDGITSS